MFTYAFDPATGSVVCLFSGRDNDDDDFTRYLAAVDYLDKTEAGRDDCVVVTVVDASNPPPNAKWRQKIGERSRTLRARAIAALVSSSPLIRGVMTVLNWLAPDRFREQVVVSKFDEAVAWVGERRPGRAILLRRLLDDARAEASERARSGAPRVARN